jgi:hypothetical protein
VQQTPPAVDPTASPPSSFINIWIDAITQPMPAVYRRFLHDPTLSSRKAYTWTFVMTLIAYAISMVESAVFATLAGTQEGGVLMMGGTLGLVICGAPVAALMSTLGLAANAGLIHLVARALGGSGTYRQLVYATACYAAPLALISGILSGVPYVNWLTVAVSLYGIVLSVVATKAVHQFGWGKAVASSVLVWVGVVALVACAVVVILLAIGPTIGNVFSDMVEGVSYLPSR